MKKNDLRYPLAIISALLVAVTSFSCSDGKTYAELLTDETRNVNAFLANQKVIIEIPEDSVFEVGEDAPYYQIDPEGNVYMQVLSVGKGDKAKNNEMIYFRYMRYDLSNYAKADTLPAGSGNADDMEYEPTWFRFDNYTLTSSAQYGNGIQMPLKFLPVENTQVNVVVKSQYGLTSEISYVVPFLYNVRYYKSPI